MFCVGGLFGSLSFCYFCDSLGRVCALRIIAFFILISHLLVAYDYTATVILISRIGFGLACGAAYITIPLFVSEISEDE